MGVPPSLTAKALHAAYEQRAGDWRRDRLGASVLGHECDRFLWQTFRWAQPKTMDGRMLRLLERGKREESWLLDDLRRIGIRVIAEQEQRQFGHLGMTADCVLLGVLEAPDEEHVGEIKTSNAKQFARLVEKGVKSAKPEHYVQMQLYMRALGIKWALYMAVCKDNDEIHMERVAYHAVDAQRAFDRGQRIVGMPEPPERQRDQWQPPCLLTAKDGTTYPCQFWKQCWNGGIPEKNCRTCVSATPMPDGSWHCDALGGTIILDSESQRLGCPSHLSIPALVGHQVVEVGERSVTYQTATGDVVKDGIA